MDNIIVFEKMNQSHISAIAEIERQCFSKPWSENAIAAELSNESAYFYVAKINGKAVGYIGMHCAADECYIANVGVLKEYRRMGIGSALVKYAANKARKMNMSFISLEVRPSNTVAVRIYERFGFDRVGLRKNFYSEPKEDGLIMTLYFKENGIL
ncbi:MULTISPECIES: ribosomal protein S18-alanine N-acetyltransferase [unclassified Ruminococcus]|uniref:ribosomal protein S18-alanine N-acetyltransferase n=1 Tax=unclassified Ruminococcus TaxID=2608920 RepID=UPI00210E2703|nr:MULTISPECIES: ribosomal protein S18-alanine N-acetyltransferase [unclassified Ruminococcus]MCQ4022726.1 ribosomal-protein-alanine N-acetyltransferase [Ruminococcus sp. zg-924]MCQ4114966.1 ribosomal-protein-alanine N-acetyltransferase [Ruminococcus sp. zg-921]